MSENRFAEVTDILALRKLRPESLSYERAMSVLPSYDIDPEWKRKREAGELPEGFLGACGMLTESWPEDRLSKEEAEYVLAASELGSMRWLASELMGDSNQIFGMDIKRAAELVIPPPS